MKISWIIIFFIGNLFWVSLNAQADVGDNCADDNVLYYITGDDRYKKSYINLMESIRQYDIHNTGAFSTEEQAIGTPYGEGSIETCDSLVVGSWLDGNAGTVYGHLETVKNIQLVEDRFGNPNKSVRFDGTGKIVYSLPYMPEKYSIVCWVKPEGSDANSQIFSAWSSTMDDPSKIFINDDSFVATIENRTWRRTEVVYKGVELQKWYHLAMVYNGTKFSFYVNGEKIKDSNKVKIYFTNAVKFCVGGNNNPDGKYFSGCIDDFALFAKVFNQKEIREIYKEGLELDVQ